MPAATVEPEREAALRQGITSATGGGVHGWRGRFAKACGVTRGTFSVFLNGSAALSVDTATAIETALELPPDYWKRGFAAVIGPTFRFMRKHKLLSEWAERLMDDDAAQLAKAVTTVAADGERARAVDGTEWLAKLEGVAWTYLDALKNKEAEKQARAASDMAFGILRFVADVRRASNDG